MAALEEAAQGSGGAPIPGSIKNLWLWHWGQFNGDHGGGVIVGPSDLKGLFQPEQFCDALADFIEKF